LFLEQNGCKVLRGKPLDEFKLAVNKKFGGEIDFGTKTNVVSIFDFRRRMPAVTRVNSNAIMGHLSPEQCFFVFFEIGAN